MKLRPVVGDYIVVDNPHFEKREGYVYSIFADGSGCTYGVKINKKGHEVPMGTDYKFIMKIMNREENPEYFL